jgi:uncharacterized membrane protein YfcA
MIGEVIAGLLSGLIGAMGLGGGAVLLIYLTVFGDTDQLKAQGINLIFFVPIALLSVIIYAVKGQIKWRIVLTLAAAGLIGAAAGVWLSGLVGSDIAAKIFGGGLVAFGIYQIISAFKNKKEERKKNKE